MNNDLKIYNTDNDLCKTGNMNIISRFLNKLADNTRISYKNTIRQFFNVEDIFDITKEMICKVTTYDAEVFRDELLNQGLKIGTIKNKINCLQSLYSYIMDKCFSNEHNIRLLSGNPFSSLEMPRIERVSKDQLDGTHGKFEEYEVARLIESSSGEFALLYELAAKTGIRKNALVNLNINTDFKKIKYKWCVNVIDKGKEVTKLIGEELYKKCVKYASGNANGMVFGFIADSTVNRNLKKDLIRIGVSEDEQKRRKLCFHSFRHTAGYLAVEYSNNNVYEANKLLGHTSVDTTKNMYLNDKDDISEISSKFGFSYKVIDDELEDKLNDMTKFDLKTLILDLDLDIKKELLKKIHGMGI